MDQEILEGVRLSQIDGDPNPGMQAAMQHFGVDFTQAVGLGAGMMLEFLYNAIRRPPVSPHAPLASAVAPASDGVDHFSRLPDDILKNVVSRLPAKDAARTAALASRWRGLWRSVPLVLVDAHILPVGIPAERMPPGGDDSSSKLVVAAALRVLAAHPGPFRCVHLTWSHMASHRAEAARWLKLLSANGVQELAFINRPWPLDLPLPTEFFGCAASLTRLHLGVWRFPRTSALPRSARFPHLKELVLSLIFIEDRDLAFLIDRSPILETLTIISSQNEVRLRLEKLEIMLALLNLDYAIRNDSPKAPTEGCENYDVLKVGYEIEKSKWDESNRKCLMIIKSSIIDGIRGAMPDSKSAKEYLSKIEDQFKGSSKVYASTLTKRLVNDKYDGNGIREHIMKKCNMAAKLKAMEWKSLMVFLYVHELIAIYGVLARASDPENITSRTLRCLQLGMSALADVTVVDAPRLERLLLWTTTHRDNNRSRIKTGHAPKLHMLGHWQPADHDLEIGNTVIKAGTKVTPRTIVPSVQILALEVKFEVRNDVKMMACFLKCFPNVETLHVYSENADSSTGKVTLKFWQEAGHIECVKSHVKKIVFQEFRGKKNELLFLKFIAETARVLEKMVVVVVFDCFSSVDDVNAKLKPLTSAKWASEDCKLSVLLNPVSESGSPAWNFNIASDFSRSNPFSLMTAE
ncbi:hypothetical protein U9M48_027545 [Paspalum notatum var. saurae]|uniref:F-box domain-containing protein n=1 Tax=Paspalum notatum var. saurae TaxID=547442 RepID=A0AAQ3TV22_PASNO